MTIWHLLMLWYILTYLTLSLCTQSTFLGPKQNTFHSNGTILCLLLKCSKVLGMCVNALEKAHYYFVLHLLVDLQQYYIISIIIVSPKIIHFIKRPNHSLFIHWYMLWVEMCLSKIFWIPNPQYFRMWPNLEIGLLSRVIKLK